MFRPLANAGTEGASMYIFHIYGFFLQIFHTYMNLLSIEDVYVFSGYVQGMSDLLSPILVVMENEVDAFWCFAGLMERVVRIPDQLVCPSGPIFIKKLKLNFIWPSQ